jgi:hypothetical protein
VDDDVQIETARIGTPKTGAAPQIGVLNGRKCLQFDRNLSKKVKFLSIQSEAEKMCFKLSYSEYP